MCMFIEMYFASAIISPNVVICVIVGDDGDGGGGENRRKFMIIVIFAQIKKRPFHSKKTEIIRRVLKCISELLVFILGLWTLFLHSIANAEAHVFV